MSPLKKPQGLHLSRDSGPSSERTPADSVLLGVFGAPHGVKGEVRIKSYTADPLAIASYGPLWGKDGRRFEIVSARPQKDMVIARIKGIEDRTAAESLTNLKLYGQRARLGDTEEDEFFHADLLGLEARTQDGARLGTVSGLFNFGAGDLIEITPGTGQAMLFPFTKAVVPLVDVKNRRLIVALPNETEEEAGDGT